MFATPLFAQEIEHFSEDFIQQEQDSIEFQDKILKEMDALLDLWYIQKQVGSINAGALNDNNEEDCLIDSVVIKRLQNLHTVIPLLYNQDIRNKI